MTRNEFLQRLKRYAKGRGVHYDFDPKRGIGSHGTVELGDRKTIVPDGELASGTLAAILRQLGITKNDLLDR